MSAERKRAARASRASLKRYESCAAEVRAVRFDRPRIANLDEPGGERWPSAELVLPRRSPLARFPRPCGYALPHVFEVQPRAGGCGRSAVAAREARRFPLAVWLRRRSHVAPVLGRLRW